MNRQILLIGIGQFGCAAADAFARKTAGTASDGDSLRILAVDTDARTADSVTDARFLSLAYPGRIADVLDAFDTDLLKDWFPCDRDNDCVEYFETLSMQEGANQWRMKAMLSLYRYLSDPKNAEALQRPLAEMADALEAEAGTAEITVTASLAGGTGSALLLPLILYIRRFFRERNISGVTAQAVLALPDITEDTLTPEQQIKARANAYAALRELNALQCAAADPALPVSFRLGNPEDPVWGLLWDAENPACRTPEGAPFSRITLMRRIPGIHSVTVHTDHIADAIRTLMLQSADGAHPDQAFSLFSQSKTVWPFERVADYLALALLRDRADAEWLALFRRSAGKLSRTADPADTVHAVMRAAEEAGDEAAAQAFLPEKYRDRIRAAAEKEFRTEGAVRILQMTNTAAEGGAAKKWGGKNQQKELQSTAAAHAADLKEYYNRGLTLLPQDGFADRLADGGDLSVTEAVLKEDGIFLPPSRALARLCALYEALEADVAYRRTCMKDPDKELTPGAIPLWLAEADVSVSGECAYAECGFERFSRVLNGNLSHLGRKAADRALFRYDITSAFARIQNIFTAERLESVLTVLGQRILRYAGLLGLLNEAYPDLAADADMALHSGSGRSGTVYFVGADPEEKRTVYAALCRRLAPLPADASPLCRADERMGAAFCSLAAVDVLSDEEMPALLKEQLSALRAELAADEFCRGITERSVMEVLLSQDGKNGADPADLAQRRAFCAGAPTMPLVLPESHDAYLWLKSLRRSVTVLLPPAARSALTARAEEYGTDDPAAIMAEILCRAGEYEGEVRFEEDMPASELCVIRQTDGIRLPMIEAVSETAECPTYYKSYLKSLAMQEKQLTALWNPYLVCSVREGDLPAVRFADGARGPEDETSTEKPDGKEESDLC